MPIKERPTKKINRILLIAVAAFLIGCGGGGGASDNGTGNDDNPTVTDDTLQWNHVLVQDLDDERNDGGGLLTPQVKAVKGGDDVHISYLNDSIDDSTMYTIYYKVWNAHTQALHTNGNLAANVIDIDSCITLDLALDAGGNPVIAYKGGELRECGIEEQSDAMVSLGSSGSWSEYTGATGYVERNPVFTDGHAGRQVSVAVDSNGDIHLAYQFLYEGCDSMNYQYPDMCYVKMDADNLAALAEEEYIEGNDYEHNNVQNNAGNHCSLVLDSDDSPNVFYYFYDPAANTGGLRVARKQNGVWEKAWIEQACEVGGISAAWNGKENTLAVAYYVTAYTDGQDYLDCLKYAEWDGSGWEIQLVDESTRCGQYPSLAFDANGNPAIAYYDIKTHNQYTRENLKHAYRDVTGWKSEVVASDGNIGKYNTIWFDGDNLAQICTYSETQHAIYIFYQQYIK